MPHVVRYASDHRFTEEPGHGFSAADLVGPASGSVHLAVALCALAPDGSTAAVLQAYEESWYVLDGSGTVSVGDVSYEVMPGCYGVVPVATPLQFSAGEQGMRWFRTRAPQPRAADPRRGVVAASGWTPAAVPARPSETDPRSRLAGVFLEEDMGGYGPLSMPGYHGPNIKSIFVRMLVDELLGARHHTLFMVEFGPQARRGHAATEHYHPFEEAYFLLSGSAIGTLDGETVEVAAGDLVWTSVNGTHGFVNEGDVPVRWLEVQAPLPPASDAFFFPKDWEALP
jgi:mannose-6-phosphate isomerase-like protein (cupin superfamily)